MSALPKESPSRRRESGVGWFLDWIGDVQVVYMDGRVDDASYDRYLEAVAAEIDGRADGDVVSVLYHVPQPSALSSERRTRLGALLKEREATLRTRTRAYVMVTPSVIVRSGLRMLFWIAPPPYPNAVAAWPREGYTFIARHHAGVEPDIWTLEHERLLVRMKTPP